MLLACNEGSPEAHFAIAMSLRNGKTSYRPECFEHFERCLELHPAGSTHFMSMRVRYR